MSGCGRVLPTALGDIPQVFFFPHCGRTPVKTLETQDHLPAAAWCRLEGWVGIALQRVLSASRVL